MGRRNESVLHANFPFRVHEPNRSYDSNLLTTREQQLPSRPIPLINALFVDISRVSAQMPSKGYPAGSSCRPLIPGNLFCLKTSIALATCNGPDAPNGSPREPLMAVTGSCFTLSWKINARA